MVDGSVLHPGSLGRTGLCRRGAGGGRATRALQALSALRDALGGASIGSSGIAAGHGLRRGRRRSSSNTRPCANGASERAGRGARASPGRHARAAIGVASLPLGACVEMHDDRRGLRSARLSRSRPGQPDVAREPQVALAPRDARVGRTTPGAARRTSGWSRGPRGTRSTVMPALPAVATTASARATSAGSEHEIGGDAHDEARPRGRVDHVATDASAELLHGRWASASDRRSPRRADARSSSLARRAGRGEPGVATEVLVRARRPSVGQAIEKGVDEPGRPGRPVKGRSAAASARRAGDRGSPSSNGCAWWNASTWAASAVRPTRATRPGATTRPPEGRRRPSP